MDQITVRPTTVIGGSSSIDKSELILDVLQVQECQLFFPKLTDVTFFLQGVTLPTVNVNQISFKTRYVDPNEIGEKVKFEPFRITFLVDKKFRNWASIYNWMKAMTVDGSTVGQTDEPVLIVGGQKVIQFIGAWPTQLGDIEFDSTVEESKYVRATLTINYDYLNYIGHYSTSDSVYK